MKTAPCKNCSTRYVGCHSDCPDYIDWQQRQEVMKQHAHVDDDYLEYKRQTQVKKLKRYWR